MIDRSKPYWTGDSPADIDAWLRLYVEDEALEVKPVLCRACGGDAFEVRADTTESVFKVKCAACGTERYILDCQRYREDARPRLKRCRVCKESRTFNLRVGLQRREGGGVRWVYIGERCTGCGTLGSFDDWRINYEPTDELEENI